MAWKYTTVWMEDRPPTLDWVWMLSCMAVREAGLQDVELVHVQVVGAVDPVEAVSYTHLSIFLCFFLRMRLRRFLISDPMSCGRLAVW